MSIIKPLRINPLLVLCFAELTLFCTYFQREIAPYWPTGSDQVAYYLNSFGLFDSLLKRDWGMLRSNLWPQGILMQGAAALSYFVFGISRLNGPLLIAFIWVLTQSVVFSYFSRKDGLWSAWFMAGLFLSVESYYRLIGGLVDFRLDAAGGLLYGISLLFLIEARRFTQKRATNLFIISALAAILTRSNIILVIAPALFFYLVYLLIRRSLHPTTLWKNLWFITKIAVAGSALCFVLIAKKFYFYYLAAYVSGDPKSSAIVYSMDQIFKVVPGSGWSYRMYPLIQLYEEHLGRLSLQLFVLAVIILILAGVLRKKALGNVAASEEASESGISDDLTLCFLYCGVPLVLYTVSVSRNPVVETTCVIPALVLLGSILTRVARLLSRKGWPPPQPLLRSLSMLILIVGCYKLTSSFTSSRGLAKIDKAPETMAREINNLVAERGIDSKKVLWLDNNETSNIMLEFYGFLQDRIWYGYDTSSFWAPELHYAPPSPAQVTLKVEASEMVLVNKKPGHAFFSSLFNRQIDVYQKSAAPVLAQRFAQYGKEYLTAWGRYQIYIARAKSLGKVEAELVTLKNRYPDWLAKEFEIEIEAEKAGFLRQVTLAGGSHFHLPKELIAFSVRFQNQDGADAAPPARVKPAIEGTWYTLRIDIPENVRVFRLAVTAERTFIPKSLGMNEDTRELVLQYPSVVKAEER